MKLNLLIAAGLIAVSSSSWAALSYNQNVNDPGPGVFYGTVPGTNLNGGWTVDRSAGIELGLRTHQRSPFPDNVFNSAGNGIYNWTDSGAGLATWNFDYSINSSVSGVALSALTFELWVDSDAGAGQAWTIFDPYQLSVNDDAVTNTLDGTNYAMNSENARFGAGVGFPTYDNNAVGTYDFSLKAFDAAGLQVANTYVRVNVNGGTAQGSFNGSVPDTGTTLGLLALSLGGLGALRRKLVA